MGSPAPSFSQVQTARSITQRSAASGGASSSGRALNSPRQSSGRGTATPSQRRSLPLPLSKSIESVRTDVALPESQSQSAGASVRSASGALHSPAAPQAAVAKPGARQMAADRSGAHQAGAARSAAQRKQSPGVQLRHSWAAPQQERSGGFSPSLGVARGLLANQGVRQRAAAGAAFNKVSVDTIGLFCVFCQKPEKGTAVRRLRAAGLDLAVLNSVLCPCRHVHQHRSEGASWTHHAMMPRQQQTQQQLETRSRCRHQQQRELASH